MAELINNSGQINLQQIQYKEKTVSGGDIMLSSIFDSFVKKSPISVMARGLIERVLNPEQLNKWFNTTAKEQYTRALLFSTIFDIMSQVVCGSRSSVHAAYQASKEDISVSITSVYNKINGIEPEISAELVRYASKQIAPIIKDLGGTNPEPLPGFRMKLLDGNCIEKTQHRLKELRELSAGPLPGKSLVVYDPVMRLPIDVFPCEDGHAQERSLFKTVLPTVNSKDLWISDRNFCTLDFTFGIAIRQGFFIIREHKKYPSKPYGKEKYIGPIETGEVYQGRIAVVDASGTKRIFRRIRVILKTETRDGDKEIFIITNLPKKSAYATEIAELYRGRWTIETAFQHLSEDLNSEINTLGYPRAALFGFCVALVSYMTISVIKAALGSVHGADVIENELSGFYVADEISGTYRGMMIAIPDEHWTVFQQMETSELVTILKMLADKVNMSAFRKHPRGPKKPQPKRKSCKKSPHVSTARIIAIRKK
jgi:hypothetical protein